MNRCFNTVAGRTPARATADPPATNNQRLVSLSPATIAMDTIRFIGTVHSSIKSLSDAPLQENEGAPAAAIHISKEFLPAVTGLATGQKIVILTWLHKSDRSILTTHPRNDSSNPKVGVFATRSPNRPNPIGLHVAVVRSFSAEGVLSVSQLEVLDGTPIIDIKPHLDR
jgi:tRNA-Thr(GGU) m(6)t(6)A37 methyltransferase TsaA